MPKAYNNHNMVYLHLTAQQTGIHYYLNLYLCTNNFINGHTTMHTLYTLHASYSTMYNNIITAVLIHGHAAQACRVGYLACCYVVAKVYYGKALYIM